VSGVYHWASPLEAFIADSLLLSPQAAKGTHPAYADLHTKYPSKLRCPLLFFDHDAIVLLTLTIIHSRLRNRFHALSVSHLIIVDAQHVSMSLCCLIAVKDRRAFRKLQELCSTLAYWCPLFAEVSYLPSFVYPFVRCACEPCSIARARCRAMSLASSASVSLPYRVFATGGGDGSVAAFELILMLLTNPCSRWFELFPNAPVPYLQSPYDAAY
jgi:hypothetical protein